ncbi:MAG: HD domain-containing protein [Mycobacteriaceae bacterium]|nr:HD domain-containing protein [Mycobacteriaceae bacterium]
MPLHAITEVHGLDGLRARFLLEAAQLPDHERILAALDLADTLHRRDRRSREPYLNHLLRVATRIISHYGIDDPDVVIAALLHDAVEDHPAELAGERPGPRTEAALAELAARFGNRVADLVAAVTNPPPAESVDRHEQYRDFVAASLDRNPWARIIKLSDFTDNGVGILYTTGPKLRTLAVKYRPLTDVYRDLVARSDTPLSAAAKREIMDQLDLADERFDAILAG